MRIYRSDIAQHDLRLILSSTFQDRAAKLVEKLADIGGTMGLLTGFSFISFAEILYYAVKILLEVMKQRKRKTRAAPPPTAAAAIPERAEYHPPRGTLNPLDLKQFNNFHVKLCHNLSYNLKMLGVGPSDTDIARCLLINLLYFYSLVTKSLEKVVHFLNSFVEFIFQFLGKNVFRALRRSPFVEFKISKLNTLKPPGVRGYIEVTEDCPQLSHLVLQEVLVVNHQDPAPPHHHPVGDDLPPHLHMFQSKPGKLGRLNSLLLQSDALEVREGGFGYL